MLSNKTHKQRMNLCNSTKPKVTKNKTKQTLKSQFLLIEYLYFPGNFLYFQLEDGEWNLS